MKKKKQIRVFIMDVDGTMTDGKIYIGQNGEVCKAFNVKDGLGIHELLPGKGILPVILTGRESQIVVNRAKELGVRHILQGVENKSAVLENLLNELDITFDEAAYIGDDLADLDVMQCCRLRGCPADAVPEIVGICEYISPHRGGEGAVRDFIEWVIQQQKGDEGS